MGSEKRERLSLRERGKEKKKERRRKKNTTFDSFFPPINEERNDAALRCLFLLHCRSLQQQRREHELERDEQQGSAIPLPPRQGSVCKR